MRRLSALSAAVVLLAPACSFTAGLDSLTDGVRPPAGAAGSGGSSDGAGGVGGSSGSMSSVGGSSVAGSSGAAAVGGGGSSSHLGGAAGTGGSSSLGGSSVGGAGGIGTGGIGAGGKGPGGGTAAGGTGGASGSGGSTAGSGGASGGTAGSGGSGAPICGDGTKNGMEACDGQDLGGATCASVLGPGSTGTVSCRPGCKLDTVKCAPPTTCGNGMVEGAEQCDGAILTGTTCASVTGDAMGQGTISCSANCTFDTDSCVYCGNGKIDRSGEICDGADVKGETCASASGHPDATGAIGCTQACALDLSSCVYCGDGKIDGTEECDVTLPAAASCATATGQDSATGSLACASSCKLDLSKCAYCGNGALDAGEACDGSSLPAGLTCASATGQKSATGTVTACTATCQADLSGCVYCGDGKKSAIETCDGTDVGVATCASVIGPTATGTLGCSPTCLQLDTSKCSPSVACGDSSGMDPKSPWPMFQRCPTHAGRTEVVASQSGTVAWKFMGNGTNPVVGTPSVGGNGTIIVGTKTGGAIGISSAGVQMWTFTGEGALTAAPAIAADGGPVVVFADAGVSSLTAAGAKKWTTHPVGSPLNAAVVDSSPVIGPDGTIYAELLGTNGSPANGKFVLAAVRGTNGATLWEASIGTYQLATSAASSPALGSSALYAGSGSSAFQLVGLASVSTSGNLDWTALKSAVKSSPAIGADGTVYVGTDAVGFAALSPAGKVLWTVSPNAAQIRSSPALAADGTIYVGIETNLLALLPNGTTAWTFTTPGLIHASPVVGGDGTVYFAAGDTVYAVRPGGKVLWSQKTGGAITASFAIGADGTLYVVDGAGTLWAFGPG